MIQHLKHFSGMYREFTLLSLIGLVAWAYQAIQPPPPKICGSPGGPPITATRIKFRDGRHLAYKEHGVSKEIAKHKLIVDHGFSSSRNDEPLVTQLSPSLALDIEELADQLGLGSKFYVVGNSMGGHAVWGCLKYIPHRLAGATLMAPVINYWWPGFPANLSEEAYNLQLPQDQWALRVAHYLPFLGVATQQGVFESIHREMRIGFGKWEFSPLDLENPSSNNEGSVHLWMGDEDRLVPVTLQRYIAKRLAWIKYNEVAGAGHLIAYVDGMSEVIVRALLDGQK
ncbi:germin-like protein subfamily 3 member 2-like [Hibiscus syriacus]|uniref:Germin-like protein subfamily 3 member 2-like n=1 Tax=Hibiscus syriacus TaxID=106335 RepID=A0A6A3AD11_HIBSY|nr:germin-like protein subfamily 3 member 2-like [Hibiscus syriacus]